MSKQCLKERMEGEGDFSEGNLRVFGHDFSHQKPYSCTACMHIPIQSSNGGQQLLQIARAAIRTHFNLEVKKKKNNINERDNVNNSRLLTTTIHCLASYKLIHVGIRTYRFLLAVNLQVYFLGDRGIVWTSAHSRTHLDSF